MSSQVVSASLTEHLLSLVPYANTPIRGLKGEARKIFDETLELMEVIPREKFISEVHNTFKDCPLLLGSVSNYFMKCLIDTDMSVCNISDLPDHIYHLREDNSNEQKEIKEIDVIPEYMHSQYQIKNKEITNSSSSFDAKYALIAILLAGVAVAVLVIFTYKKK